MRRFRNVAFAAAATTFVLILAGGIVRISDSGLGCGRAGSGTDGWPLCGGGLVPGVDTNMVIEYTHRILAAIVTVLIATLVVMAWRNFRNRPQLLRLPMAAFGLVLFQAALGGLTVEKGLKQELVATHLGIAMLQIGLLLIVARFAQQAASDDSRPLSRAPRSIRVVAVTACVAVLATIVAGGYMSASELHGTTPAQANSQSLDAHMACGSEFPTCNNSFLPFGESKAKDIHLTHRSFVYLTTALVLLLLVLIMVLARRQDLDRRLVEKLTLWAWVVAGVLCVQVLLGALNVWLGEHEWLIVVHLLTGTALWACLVSLTYNALGLQVKEATQERAQATAEAVPA